MKILKLKPFISVAEEKAIEDFSHLLWVDCHRSATLSLGKPDAMLHAQHMNDLKNSLHPPYFEQTDDYELIIFRAMDRRFEISEPRSRAIAILLIENTIITIHDENDASLNSLFENWDKRKHKQIGDVLALLHLILDEIVNVYLNIREPLDTLTSEWQQKLLDPNDPFNDWNLIMQARSRLRGLNTTLALQKEALAAWRETTRYQFSTSHIIKFNDLNEHLSRIERLSEGIRTDLDSLTQTYFASTGQQTNSKVQFLAVISAIFLPLNLIAGIFGMNFATLPFLSHPLAPYVVVFLMLLLTALLLWWFKKKNWY